VYVEQFASGDDPAKRTMNGAVESGLRAAEEVLAMINVR
jgi:hypothetical protein